MFVLPFSLGFLSLFEGFSRSGSRKRSGRLEHRRVDGEKDGFLCEEMQTGRPTRR